MIGWVFFLVLIELVIVSWIDIKTKKISNLWFFVNLILCLGFHFFFPAAFPWEWAILFYPVGWIVFGFFLFLVGIMGAGDSKYLASLFLVIPLDLQTEMLARIVYSTLVVGLVVLLLKIAKDFRKIKAYAFSSYWKGLIESIRSSFSYAPVILLAWILLGAEKWK